MPNKLYYPEFSEDILILLKNGLTMKLEVIQDFSDSVKKLGFTFRLENYENKYDHIERSFNNYACINIFINDSIVISKENALRGFISECETFFLPYASFSAKNNLTQLIVFTRILSKKLRFDFNFRGDVIEYKTAFETIFKVIQKYRLLKSFELEKQLEKNFNPNDYYINLSYINNEWQVIDPLVHKIRKSSIDYKEGKDFRINKPNVKINENSHSELFTFEDKWTLRFDKLYINMFKPNDVSLYSNISEKNLKEAKELYHKLINTDDFFLNSAFPNENAQIEYFNYFEKIIQSIIFAFTSIEALLNLCFDFEKDYEWKKIIDGKSEVRIYKGEAIERFQFKEKFEFISKKILDISDLDMNKIYSRINKIKKLRDEVIHSKPSKSELRYSRFLKKDIFTTIESHKVVIKIIGIYIFKNQKYLLNEFPFNFEQDEFYPSILTDEESIQLFNYLHRPSSNNNPINTSKTNQ